MFDLDQYMSNEYLDESLSMEYNAVNLDIFDNVSLPDNMNKELESRYRVNIRLGLIRTWWEHFKHGLLRGGPLNVLIFKFIANINTRLHVERAVAKNRNYFQVMNKTLDDVERELKPYGYTLLTVSQLDKLAKANPGESLKGGAQVANGVMRVLLTGAFHGIKAIFHHYDQDLKFCTNNLKGRYVQNYVPSLLRTDSATFKGKTYGGIIHSYGMAIAIKTKPNPSGRYEISPIKVCKYTFFASDAR